MSRSLGVSQNAAPRSGIAGPVRALALAVLLAACGGATEQPLRMGVGGDVTRQHRTPPPEPVVDQSPRAWLWEVRGPDSLAPSYVFGTLHIGVTRSRALPPPLEEFLYDARAVVMEIDLREADRMLRAPSGGRRRPLSRREWLDRALPPLTWQLLLGELGHRVPADILRQLPPALLTHYLLQVRMAEVEALDEGREPVRGAASTARLDRSILEWAVAMGRPIIPLETLEQQIEALSRVRRGRALEALRAIVEQAEDMRARMRELRAAYLALDEQRVLTMLERERIPEEHEVIVLERNRAWMEELLPQLEEGRAFVAVGLAHLVGDGNVLDLLRQRGYEVRRVGGYERPQSRR